MKKPIFSSIHLLALCLSLSACSSGKDSPSSGTPGNGNTNPPEAEELPGTPTNLMATPGDHQVTLSWEAPSAGGSAITHYEYQQSLTSDTFDENTWTLAPGAESARQVTVSGLTVATTYFFRVRAVNTQGTGIPSSEMEAIPYDASIPTPGQPTNLVVTSGDRQVTLSWVAPNAGASVITHYEYQYRAASASGTFGGTWTHVSGAGLTVTISGLMGAATYFFRVRAVNAQGAGTPSTEMEATAYDGLTPTPGVPRNLAATPGDRQVTLNWEAPSVGASVITRYEYQYSTTSNTFGGTWTNTSGTETTVSSLTGATTYYFRVRAVNAQGAGIPSSEMEATAYDGPTAEPGQPRNLAATPGDRQVILSWEAPSVGASVITHYEYQYSTTSSAFGGTWANTSGTGTTVTISSLTGATTYFFRVRAVNAQGAGIPSSEMEAIAYDGSTAEPGQPINLAATPGDRQVTLSWEAPRAGASVITHYEYQYSMTSRIFGGTWANTSGTGTTVTISSLTGATTYFFRVRAVNAQGAGIPSSEMEATAYDGTTPTPEAPPTLTVTPGDGQVTLSWEAPRAGASVITRYEYQYSTTSETFGNTWTTVTGTGTTVTVSSLTGATTYFFRVRAVNAQGAGTPSSEIEATAYDGSTAEPGAPTNLEATPGDGQVTLSWEAPSHIGDSAITGYEYQYKTASGTFSDTWTTVTGTETTISSLTGATTYFFRVRAVNGEGSGHPTQVSVTPYDGSTPEPGAPTNLAATPGDHQVTLNWAAPSVGASVITHYEYQYSTTSETFGGTWTPVTGTGTTVTVSSLTGATTYYFRVRAVNTQGPGTPSSEIEATAYDGLTPEPGQPTDLAATPGDRQVTLNWEAPSAGASAITRYEYQQSLTSETFDENTWADTSGTGTTVTVSSLTGATTYYFRVRAVNTQGGGTPSTEIEATAYDGLTPEPGQPTNLAATSGDRQVTLNWEAPSVGASAIIRYEYQQSLTSETFDENTWADTSGTETTVTVSSLTGATTYYFRVRAVNAQGAGTPSSEIEATAYDGLAPTPAAPPTLTPTSGDRQVTLSWEAPSTVGASPITHYEYQYRTTSDIFDENTWTIAPGAASARQVTVSGLTGATTYTFRVRAVNTQGGGTPSSEIEAAAYDGLTPEPGAPTNLAATSGDRQVTLNWEAPSAVGASPITRYEYQQSLTSSTFDENTWADTSGTETTVTVSSLTGATTYYFRVRAVNTQGAGTPSSEIEAIAYDGSTAEPGAPTNLAVTSGDRQVTLSWEAPSVGVSPITRYEYQYSTTSDTFDENTWTLAPGAGSARQVTVSSLTGATNYFFRVRAVNTQGAGIPSSEIEATAYDGPTPEPGAPINLTPTSGDRQVTLSWEAPSAVGASAITHYEYQQSLTSSTFDENTWTLAPGAGSARQVTADGLIGATTYYFRVRAVNAQGAGTPSSEIEATAYDGPTPEPGAPINLTPTSAHRRVRLNWEAPNAGASAINHYEYQQSTTSGSFDENTWIDVYGNGNILQVNALSLTPTTTYFFRVRAVNSYGHGPASTQVEAIAYDGSTPEPGAPTNLAATSGDRQVTLRWEPTPVGASVITHYQYQQSTTSGSFDENMWIDVPGNGNTLQVTVDGLIGVTTYFFRVRAVNSYGHGPASTQVEAITYDGLTLTPGAPTNLAVIPGGRRVTLNWEAPNAGTSAITHYEYQQRTASGTFDENTWTNIPGDGATRQAIISDLTGATTYIFRVRAVNAQGGGESAEIEATPYDGPIAEPDLTVCSDSATTAGALPGVGTADDPFVLCLPAHLSLIGDTEANTAYTLSASYVMGQNIDLNNESFTPIAGNFAGTFDGRGKRIMNLTINVSGDAALFLNLNSAGSIKNLGIKDFNVTGSGRVGSLVAKSYGMITNCYAVDSDDSIDLSGGNLDSNPVGSLVGTQLSGRITSSYATGNPDGGGGKHDSVGGLVGNQTGGSITSSYATGNPNGGGGISDNVGGLVGYQTGGSITSSYATGNPDGGGGASDYVGGLVGTQDDGTITSSYTTGNPDGGGGAGNIGVGNYVGGLVGRQTGGTITSSYTTGNPDGGGGNGDYVGGLMGYQSGGSISSSYGFGTTVNVGTANTHGTPPSDVTSASDLTQSNSGDSEANRWSNDAWDFGTGSQAPALKYVDSYELGNHDDDDSTSETYAYTCTSSTAFLPSIYITCETTLLPEQGR